MPAKKKIDNEEADYDSIRLAQNALSGLRFEVGKTIKKECDKVKHKDVITVLEKFDGVIRDAEFILKGAKEKLDKLPEEDGSAEQQKRRAKKFNGAKPKVYFSSVFLANHVHEAKESLKKRAEEIFQRRKAGVNTVIGFDPGQLTDLASEIFDRQDEFAKAPKGKFWTKGKHQLWSRGGKTDKDQKRATFTNSKFQFKVIKDSDGIFVLNHFEQF